MSSNTNSSKKIIWIIIVILLLAGVIFYLFFKKSGSLEVVANCDKIVQETLAQKVSATGTINPVQTVEVGTQVSGTIEKLFVDFNDEVKAGQVINTITDLFKNLQK